MKSKKSLIVLGVIFAIVCVVCILLAIFFEKEPSIPNPNFSTEFSVTKASEAFSESIKYESPIDFASIKKDSPDVFAWLKINGTEILTERFEQDAFIYEDFLKCQILSVKIAISRTF